MLRLLSCIGVLAVLGIGIGLEAKAGPKVYLRKEVPGIRTYVTDYAASKDWNIRCTRQTSGRTLGEPRCVMEPWQGSVYPRTGIRKGASKGLEVEITVSDVSVKFVPLKVAPGTSYSVKCGSSEFGGTRSTRTGLSRYEASFEGSEAMDLIEAMKAASFCNVNFLVNRGGPVNAKVSMIGMTDAIKFSRSWLVGAR